MNIQERRRLPWTVAVRWCSVCDKFLGIRIWPAEARLWVHTHGFCNVCFERRMGDSTDCRGHASTGSRGPG